MFIIIIIIIFTFIIIVHLRERQRGYVFNNWDRSSEDVLRGIFSAFGLVQTCIVNVEKRHAFVKMLTRSEAMIAKEGMERYKSSEMQLRVCPSPFASRFPATFRLTNRFLRLDGAWALGHEIAVTTRRASASSQLTA